MGIRRSCKLCQMLFVPENDVDTCHECTSQLNEYLEVVVNFLREYPKSSVYLVSRETNVSPKIIKHLIKQDHFITTLTELGIEATFCKKCGVIIPKGRLCGECKVENFQSQAKSYFNLELERKKSEEKEDIAVGNELKVKRSGKIIKRHIR